METAWHPFHWPAWAPGVLLGAVSLVYGLAVGFLISRKTSPRLVVGLHLGMIALSGVLVVVAVWAYAAGEPRTVWENLGMPGAIGVFMYAVTFTAVRRACD
ncbi:MAG: hypothetical protein HZB55_17760 [Deltaproteobacteria bacterium]|nr:hypothetical protein [Deltaproteobacteria bacterium]